MLLECERLELLTEDYWGASHAQLAYGVCSTRDRGVHYVSADSPCFSGAPADHPVTLNVSAPALDPIAAASALGSGRRGGPVARALPQAEIARTAGAMAPRSARALVDTSLGAAMARTVVTLRLVYTDAAPDYCHNECADNGMWGTAGGVKVSGTVTGWVNDALKFSSYGATSLDQAASVMAVTVMMGNHTPEESLGCNYHAVVIPELNRANDLAKSQLGIDPNLFTHREYFIPREFGSCNWGGIGNVGCAPPGREDSHGRCFTVIRDAQPMTRVHELGHNLGLYHAGIPANSYGDTTSVMGQNRHWKACDAPPTEKPQLGVKRALSHHTCQPRSTPRRRRSRQVQCGQPFPARLDHRGPRRLR